MNVGFRQIEVWDEVRAENVPTLLFYPTSHAVCTQHFGPFLMDVAIGAPLMEQSNLLVVISHGNGGTPWVHRDLAIALAHNGACVLVPEHLGNSKFDNSLEGLKENLVNRPRQLKMLIEYCGEQLGLVNDNSKIVCVGHSIGGYSVLALAGAKPNAGPHETASGQVEPVETDQLHIDGLVLLSPALLWFQGDDAFDEFNVPTLMLSGDTDQITPASNGDILAGRFDVPEQFSHHVIDNAGHFSFQSPFPASMTRTDFPPSQDPAGFNRAGFQVTLAEIVGDFIAQLTNAPRKKN